MCGIYCGWAALSTHAGQVFPFAVRTAAFQPSLPDTSRLFPSPLAQLSFNLSISMRTRAQMSIGRNPQFDNKEKSAEPWLLHTFEHDFYGAEIRLMIMGYIRPEGKFESLEALVERIHKDGEVSKAFLEASVAAQEAKSDPFLLG